MNSKSKKKIILIFVVVFCMCCCLSSIISGGSLFFTSDKKDEPPSASPPAASPTAASPTAASPPAVSSYFTEGVNYSIKGGRDGKYCTNDKGLICNRSAIAGWEKFKFIHQGDNIYAIKSMRSGKQCKDNRGDVSKCDTDHIQGHEKFVIEKHGDKYSIKGGWGNKYCSDQSVGLVCNTDHLLGWEKFTITKA